MNIHTIGTDAFGIFEKSNNTSLLTLHFLWGKKDFRLFLERKEAASGKHPNPALLRKKGGDEYALTCLQYLYEYEWYDYDKVNGHGLAHDEVRWVHNGMVRYLELPLRFYDIAAELACREFGMSRKKNSAQGL